MRRIGRRLVTIGFAAVLSATLFATPAAADGFEEHLMVDPDGATCDFGSGNALYSTSAPYTVMMLERGSIEDGLYQAVHKFNGVHYYLMTGEGPESFLATGTITGTVIGDLVRAAWSWTLTTPEGTRLGNSSGVMHLLFSTGEVIRHISSGVCSEP